MSARTRRTPLPRARRLADNILSAYDRATPTELADGRAWYESANTLARELADAYGTTVEHAAGVIAVLSPQVSWNRNVIMAREVFATGATRGLGNSVAKARRLIGATPYAVASPDDVVRGDKVSAFYANILNPHGDHVTIDRHAFDIAQGRRTDDKTRGQLTLKNHYARYCEAYKLAATEIGIGAIQLQAIVWCAWRREHGITA